MENKIYYSELECYYRLPEEQKLQYNNQFYDLTLLPTLTMQEEFTSFLHDRAKKVSMLTIHHDITKYHRLCQFLSAKRKLPDSFQGWKEEVWIQALKSWMLKNGLQWTRKLTSIYGTESVGEDRLVLYFRWIIHFIEPEDERSEIEKDVWNLSRLEIPIRENLIHNVHTISFMKIQQEEIKEELKRAIFQHLQYDTIGTVNARLTSFRRFSKHLSEKKSEIKSCRDIDRAIMEDYLVYKMTNGSSGKSNASDIYNLRSILETIGKIFEWPHLENLIIQSDIPPEMQPEFRVYSDAEIKRLNAGITKLDEQITRCMVIHQMLGTRISDTLTLKQDCLYKNKEQYMIRIYQPKTHMYEKPISVELGILIERAIEYTQLRFPGTSYVFVNESDVSRPLQYTTIKNKVLRYIMKEDLRDDEGRLFRFDTHMFRHYYGVKLTELHLDDWTIAKLLGHSGLKSVQYYRKMSNQILADETRKIREKFSEIILANLDGWGEEYEQIR